MKETITIKNFGGLKDVTIPLNSINIFIGKQATGKSVTAKLIYFFKNIFEDISIGLYEQKSQQEIESQIIEKFKNYFPVNIWSSKKFYIKYQPGGRLFAENKNKIRINLPDISVEKSGKNNIKIQFSNLFEEISRLKKNVIDAFSNPKIKSLTDKLEKPSSEFFNFIREVINANPFGEQIFIPAGRSFFSTIQNSIFSILTLRNTIDPFLLEFGSIYEVVKNSENQNKTNNISKRSKYIGPILEKITGARFVSDKTGDYLVHSDKRKIGLLNCSSGQQEVLPLALVLKNFGIFELLNNTIYIEEPEAHLFPSAQKNVVEMIATSYNLSDGRSELFITTHSPYILTSFNNLLQAGQLLESGANKKKLFKIVPEFEILKPGELNAYAFENGGVTNLIDEETGLISADLLDQVSEEIAIQFEQLLDL